MNGPHRCDEPDSNEPSQKVKNAVRDHLAPHFLDFNSSR